MIELFHDENNNGILENSLQTIKVPPSPRSSIFNCSIIKYQFTVNFWSDGQHSGFSGDNFVYFLDCVALKHAEVTKPRGVVCINYLQYSQFYFYKLF